MRPTKENLINDFKFLQVAKNILILSISIEKDIWIQYEEEKKRFLL